MLQSGGIVFYFYLLLLPLWSQAQALEPNHAPLHPQHVSHAEDFIERNFKTAGVYDVIKFDQFIQRLDKEYQALRSDIYETTLMQAIEIQITDMQQARQMALEEIENDKNNLLRVFTRYLRPSIESIRQQIAQGASVQHIDALVDRFIELYHVYFIPKVPRNRWDHDRSHINKLKIIQGLRYAKNKSKIHANNLIPGDYIETVMSCVSEVNSPTSPLTQEQLERLENCGFDLSLLEPVPNPFFKNLTEEEKQARKFDFLKFMPRSDEKFTFEFVIYNGAGSPKFVASYLDDEGKKRTIKIKLGKETHQDPTTSMLGKLLGLHQDHGKAYPQMKIYFKDISIETFIARWRRKYRDGSHDIAKYIIAQSKKHETEQWILIRDLSIEARDPDRKNLTPYDAWGWDLPNRREHRAIALWYAFVAARDLKNDNHTVHLRERGDSYELEYSPQDVGISLGTSVDLRFPVTSLTSGNGKTVNHFRPTFLSWSDQHVHIHWADTLTNRMKFYTATYDDMRWMARKILALTPEDYDYAFDIGGYPKAITNLYKIKFSMRRNELIQAFELQDEFESWEMPELSSYSDPPYIRNGVVVVDMIEGHTLYQANTYQSDLTRNIVDLISRYLPLERMFNGINAALDRGLTLTNEQILRDLTSNKLGKIFMLDEMNGKIKFSLKRQILLNDADYALGPNASGRYIVKDSLTVGFGLESELELGKIANLLPVSLKPQVTVYERSYEHIQVATNWKAALKAPFTLFNHILVPLTSVAYDLDRGDVFKIQNRVGFKIDAEAGIGLTSSPFLQLDFKAGVGWSWSRPLYIHRDQLGDVILFRESRKDFNFNASMQLLGIDFYFLDEFPLLGVSYTYSKIDQQSELYKFSVSDENEHTYHRLLKKKELSAFFDGGNPVLYMKNRMLDVQAHGHIQRIQLDFLLFIHAARTSSYFKIRVDGQEGTKNFYRYHLMSESFIGDKQLVSVLQLNPWMLVKQHDQWSVSIELEESNIADAVAVLEYQDFRMKLNKPGLINFISGMNRRFSSNGKGVVFQTDHLPPEWEVKNYFKIYSHMRVHVGVGKFIQSVNKNSFEQIKKRIYAKSRALELKLPSGFIFILRRGINEIIGHRYRPAKQVKAVASLLRYINKQKNPIPLLREVVGEENLFVFGEIIGVYHGYTLTQEHDSIPTRTFAAKSWGGHDGIPPIRRYLKDNLVAPIYLHLLADDITSDVWGKLPRTGGPPIL